MTAAQGEKRHGGVPWEGSGWLGAVIRRAFEDSNADVVDVSLVDDYQTCLRLGREAGDLCVVDGGASRVMRIAYERQLTLDTGHGVEVMSPVLQRDARHFAAKGADSFDARLPSSDTAERPGT